MIPALLVSASLVEGEWQLPPIVIFGAFMQVASTSRHLAAA